MRYFDTGWKGKSEWLQISVGRIHDMCFINDDNSFYGRETCIRYLENVWKMSSLSRMKGYQTMSATERRDKNVKIKKLGNRVTYERSTYSTSPHTYTGWAGCFFKSVGNKKLAFPLLLSNPSPIFRSYSRPSMQEAVELRKGPQFDYPGSWQGTHLHIYQRSLLSSMFERGIVLYNWFWGFFCSPKKKSSAANCRDSLFFLKGYC